MMDDTLQRFAQSLAGEVEENLNEDTPFSEGVFTSLVLEKLEDAGHLENAFDLYQEGRIRNAGYRIDGYAFDEDRLVLDLFTTLYTGSGQGERISTADVNRAFERSLRFAAACVDGLAAQLEPSNTDASDLARLIQSRSGDMAGIRIILLTDGVVGSLPSSPGLHGTEVTHEAYDIVRLQRVLGEGETRADISVDLVALTGSPIPSLHVPSQDNEYDAYLAVLPGDALSSIYERYGVRLLELNVRAFLGLQGRKSVNAELRRTIVEQPSMFLAYNNGIVATVDDLGVVVDEQGGTAITFLQGLQIVNGGQTIASLHRARRKESLSLGCVSVPLKIIKVGGADLGQMVGSISRAANRQNTVQLADFSANDPFHQEIETLANNTWLDDGKGRWFYERARGSYTAAEQKASYRKTDQSAFRAQTPKARRLGKLDVARYLSAWSGLPNRVCLGGQKNFQHFMQRMKDSAPPPPDTIWFQKAVAIAILYRAAEKKIRSMKFPAYGAQITAYVVAGLAHKTGGRIDFARIWSRQGVSPELIRLIEEWAPQLDTIMRRSAGQRNPSEWYKKEDCWREIQAELPSLTDPLPAELTYEGSPQEGASAMIPTGTVSVADYERIAQCLEVSGTLWLEVAERGQQAGVVHWRVAGICRTLASYAAGGWQRKPSPKQAKPALEALQAARQAGVIGGDQTASAIDQE
jgi:hypothetical protein